MGSKQENNPWLLKSIVDALVLSVTAGLIVTFLGPRITDRFREPTCGDTRSLERISPQSVEATSSLPGEKVRDRRGTLAYKPKLAVDGDTGTAWVEGAKNFGLNQAITFHFSKPRKFVLLCVVNGYALTWDLYESNARVRGVDLTTADGESENATLSDPGDPDQPAHFQDLRTRLNSTETLKLTITSVYAPSGRERYWDTCVSEVEFWAAA